MMQRASAGMAFPSSQQGMAKLKLPPWLHAKVLAAARGLAARAGQEF